MLRFHMKEYESLKFKEEDSPFNEDGDPGKDTPLRDGITDIDAEYERILEEQKGEKEEIFYPTPRADGGVPVKEPADRVMFPVRLLRKRLTPLQYKITQDNYMETKGTGIYNDFFEDGRYDCIVCNANLFTSEQKYKSDCGWATFSAGDKVNIDGCKTSDLEKNNLRCRCCYSNLGSI